MNEFYGQTEKALSTAAQHVDVARGEVKSQCGVLSGRVQEMMAGWGGQGATAMTNLMVAWQDKQETVLKALDQLSIALVETERDNVATDEGEASNVSRLGARLG